MNSQYPIIFNVYNHSKNLSDTSPVTLPLFQIEKYKATSVCY
ncbi:protein of unknown function [Clostridium beijerinckii]|nr:protein of unknown function [Clostridium beijerinckii]